MTSQLQTLPSITTDVESASQANQDQDHQDPPPKPVLPFPLRYLITGLLCLGCFTTSMSGAIMNSTILAMAPQRSTSVDQTPGYHQVDNMRRMQHPALSNPKLENTEDSVCSAVETQSNRTTNLTSETKAEPHFEPEFEWSEQRQNLLLVSYSIGYVACLLPAGVIVEHYGGKWIAIIGGAGHVVINLVAPSAARVSYWILFSSRIILGGVEAAVVPSFYYFVTAWVPDNEKSKAIAALSIGGSSGAIFLNLVSGYVCQNIGWSLVFYLVGMLNLIWLFLWLFLTTNRPFQHPWITRSELEYINSKTSQLAGPKPVPSAGTWFRMLFSMPVFATVCVSITHSWFYGVLLAKMSTYMIAVLQMNLEQTSLFNTVHQTVLLVSVLVNGVLSDMATDRECCKKTTQRKCFESVATFGTALFMTILVYTGCNRLAYITMLSLAVGCVGSTTGGSDIVIFDLTSSHASTLVSLVSSINTVFGLFIPSLVTLILDQSTSDRLHAQWNLVFYATAAFHCTGGLVFWAFGSTDKQKWDD